MASDAAFHVEVYHVVSGNLVSTVDGEGSQRAIDVKAALEGQTQTPARYQKLLLPNGEVLRDDQTLGSCLEVGGHLRVGYLQAEALDFVHAVRDGIDDLAVLRYMLANGSDINAKADGEGRPPNIHEGLESAVENHMLSIGMAGASALHHAANRGLTKVCRLLLDDKSFTEINSLTGGEDEGEDGGRMTALHVAALNGHSEVCCMLLSDDRFERIDDKIMCGELFASRDALALACQKGLPRVVDMLLKDPRCTGINKIVDQYDTTVLMLAACTNTPGNIEVCKLIMADTRFTLYEEESCRGAGTKLSGSAYEIAKKNGLEEIVKLWDEWRG